MNVVIGFVITSVVALVAVAVMLFVRRRAPDGSYFADGDRASGVFGVLASGFAILLGFIVFLAFTTYDESRAGAEAEAVTVAQQVETAQFFEPRARERLSGELVCYARYVAGPEWDRLEDGSLGEELNPWGSVMFDTLKMVEPQTASEEAAYSKWLDQTADRQVARQDRVHGAVGVIPTPLWIVLFTISFVIFVYMLFFADSGERAVTQAMLMGRSCSSSSRCCCCCTSSTTLSGAVSDPCVRSQWSERCGSSTKSSKSQGSTRRCPATTPARQPARHRRMTSGTGDVESEVSIAGASSVHHSLARPHPPADGSSATTQKRSRRRTTMKPKPGLENRRHAPCTSTGTASRHQGRWPRPMQGLRLQPDAMAWIGLYRPDEHEVASLAVGVPAPRARGRGRDRRPPTSEARALRRHPVRRAAPGSLSRRDRRPSSSARCTSSSVPTSSSPSATAKRPTLVQSVTGWKANPALLRRGPRRSCTPSSTGWWTATPRRRRARQRHRRDRDRGVQR